MSDVIPQTPEQELVLKTIQTSDFANGGALNPLRQKKFTKYVREGGRMLKDVRFEVLSQSQMVIDKMYIGEPVTSAVGENDNTAFDSAPSYGQIKIDTNKLKSSWNITTETLVENIETQGFEDTLMEGMSRRIATDIELLAIQGDATKYAGATDVYGRLLKRADGWDKQTQNCHILDVSAASVQKGIFAEMVRMMPQMYLQDPDLRWFVSKSIAIDWLDLLADRGTGLGDNALNGNSVSPYGIPMEVVPLIPDNKPVQVSTGTAAEVIGGRADVFTVTANINDQLIITVNGGAAQTVTLPAGTLRVGTVAATINAVPALAGIATDDGWGKLILTSPTVGSASTIVIGNAGARDAAATLGLVAGTTTGANSGTGGSIPEGSFIWLANPKNFIAAMRGNTRVYSWFNMHYDRLETVIYNEVDFKIENDDAIVKAVNLRKRQLI